MYLGERIPGLSRARIQRAILERVTLSWVGRARPSTSMRPGGEVRIGWSPIVEPTLEVRIAVLARGAGWLAVDKPAGLPVHPVNAVRENSVIRMLRRQESRESLRLCHRLDRETSGVLLVAEDARTARVVASAFEEGRVAKEYLALVEGRVEGESESIDLPIGRGRSLARVGAPPNGAGRAAGADALAGGTPTRREDPAAGGSRKGWPGKIRDW